MSEFLLKGFVIGFSVAFLQHKVTYQVMLRMIQFSGVLILVFAFWSLFFLDF